ncbi:MAG: hypothetical protein BGP13_00200 [Sphingobacteriales bacterium 40-81]|nr:MAG: hypothetical protein BGP13_00200 [Sphingobacteriales bacterium 40-81]
MNLHVNDIPDHLFQKRALEDVDAGDIEQLVIKYPFYAPAQYLLAKKYQQPGGDRYTDQLKKTALYFTNPHWLNALLHPETLPEREVKYIEKEAGIAGKTVVDAAPDYITEEEEPVQHTFGKTIVDIVEERLMVEEKSVEPEIDEVSDTGTAEQAENIESVQYEEPGETLNPELPVTEIKTGNEVLEQLAEAETVAEKGDENVDENVDEAIEKPHLQEDIKLPTGDFSLAQAKAAFDQPLPADDHTGDIIPIEPLHTVDYFASQGIKLSHEYEGKDKLSKKLKSFTEWLKTMKKIHPERLEGELDNNTQSSIQNIAEHSNEQKEVVTEAMAEVYARQGLHKKAIETYQKLSLLNPDKRVYFAAKISKLNEN